MSGLSHFFAIELREMSLSRLTVSVTRVSLLLGVLPALRAG